MPFSPNSQQFDSSAGFEAGVREEDLRPGESSTDLAGHIARGLLTNALSESDRAILKARGIDLSGRLGHECEEMRKYFGQGTGTYLAVADFENARAFAQKVTDAGAERCIKALDVANWRLVPQNRWQRFLDLFRK